MFAGFTDRDFDAYAPTKWKSNVFNRERLEVKQKLVSLGKELGGMLAAADGSPLYCEASAEHPALWNHKQVEAQYLFFSRNEGARRELDRIIDRSRPMTTMLEDPTPQRNHLFLSIMLDHAQVEFALKLHPDARVDRQNLERKLADTWEREKFVSLVRELGPDFTIGVAGKTSIPAVDLDDLTLRDLGSDLGSSELPGQAIKTHWFHVHRSLARSAITADGLDLVLAARQDLSALLPVYQFVAWARDNDFVSMRDKLKQEKQAKRQKGLVKNDRVRIVRGIFSGRAGVIQEIDAKGALRVLVGTVAVKLGADEVEKT